MLPSLSFNTLEIGRSNPIVWRHRYTFTSLCEVIRSLCLFAALLLIKQVRVLFQIRRSYTRISHSGHARLVHRQISQLVVVLALIELINGLLFNTVKFGRDKLDCTSQVLAAILQLTLHLTAAC